MPDAAEELYYAARSSVARNAHLAGGNATPDAATESNDATKGWARGEAHNFAVVWIEAYLEASKVAMDRRLPKSLVLRCARQVANEVLNRYMQRLEDGKVG